MSGLTISRVFTFAESNDKGEVIVNTKSSRRMSGHGFLISLEIKKSESESGNSDSHGFRESIAVL